MKAVSTAAFLPASLLFPSRSSVQHCRKENLLQLADTSSSQFLQARAQNPPSHPSWCAKEGNLVSHMRQLLTCGRPCGPQCLGWGRYNNLPAAEDQTVSGTAFLMPCQQAQQVSTDRKVILPNNQVQPLCKEPTDRAERLWHRGQMRSTLSGEGPLESA